MKNETLIIIAALNEGKTIGKVIEEAKQEIESSDILVLDGFSRDDTVEVSVAKGASVVQVAKAFGIGGAVEAGILYAYRNGYKYLVRIDADGQHRPSDIKSLLAYLKSNEVDFVIGSRFLGDAEYKPTLLRNSSIYVISFLIRLLYKIRITDVTSGCHLYNRSLIEFFAQDTRFEYSEIRAIWTASKAGFRISERFLNMAPRQAGVSSFSPLNAFLYMFKNIIDIIFSVPVFVRRLIP